ncbi:putative 3-beta hydroxysteroid dehydrogenase/isomerase family protein [Pseudovirgaria hyperparasitica]|uniref:Putative 3-beta hydroxysteroid dehydrogenase/isomerase family protein n=1 Tax=Pseudovirgaria hyperparasitica TaxID=470096 RepID=A0A6A6W2T5_9PEZI|nr:putative 3-beta hydroxysteroid dehydrogenase/isomerase family protein [Pseudovirgaria hyperparasitica]KAF2757248.1 putative 3-beta hydroxysteroid dehydrogenase/isomerase family protein [Pseudovirgaria hyperparasitica]
MATETILVVGGCGGLGYNIVKQCLHNGYSVAVLDIRTDRHRVDKAQYFEGSLVSRETVTDVLRTTGATVIINTASPRLVHHQPNEVYDKVNVLGTANLLDCARNASSTVKALIYTSSSSVIHDNTSNLVRATEALPYVLAPAQKEHYTHTKALAERSVLAFNGQAGILTAALRPATLFGEADQLTIPTNIENARAGRLRFQVGDGTNLFDWTYAGNAAYAHILAVKALLREREQAHPLAAHLKVNGEAFNITNDEPWPFWDVPRAIGAAAGYPVAQEAVWVIPAQVYFVVVVCLEWIVWLGSFGTKTARMDRKMVRFVTMTRTFDVSKAKERLGYRAQVGMQEGIRLSVDWYMAHGKGEGQ